MATYIYTRVSTADQADGTSLDEQERKANAAATMADLTVERVFTDAGISGSVALSERPQGGDMWSLLQSGDTVIVLKIDRLFRSAADALSTVERWKALGVNLIIAEFGLDPVTENGVSRLLFGILSMVAEFERDLIRQRMADGRAAKVANGGHIGGSAPFGFRKVGQGRGAMLEPVEAEQAAIDQMVALKADGASLRAIADAMSSAGHTISHVAVKNALLRREKHGRPG